MVDPRLPDMPATLRGTSSEPAALHALASPTELAHPDTMGVPGTRTVHNAPRLPRVYLPRPRLWAQLDDGPLHGITLLIAPNGAGKTLGVGGWLRTSTRVTTAIWAHADNSWTARRLFESVDSLTDAASASTGIGATPPLVVIDDAHLLPPATLAAIDERLNRAPETMRLILLSRWDLPVTRLAPALLGNCSILRGDLLRLNRDECATLIAEHGRNRNSEVIEAVIERTQGWCAAVVLAARTIRAHPDPVAAAQRHARGSSSAVDQLASEVFTALDPRERHLLLTLAGEEIVTADTAAHLSHDAGAGQLLASLESTGLLVTRLLDSSPAPERTPPAAPAQHSHDSDSSPRYRIHPLLVEVVRRRVAAGGVDVTQAQDTVRRAVHLDIARGDASRALGRLIAVDLPIDGASVLAQHGITVLMQGQGAAIAEYARRYPSVVETHPGVWFPIAIERWFHNDIGTAAHWLDRCKQHLLQHPDRDPDPPLGAALACTRLLRALLGSEPATDAEAHARREVARHLRTTTSEPLMPLLLAMLGMVQAHLGKLKQAEVTLTSSVAASRAHGLVPLTYSALSYLALVLYMEGRELASIQVAKEVLLVDHQRPPWHTGFSFVRARIVHDLATLSDVPSMTTPGLPDPAEAQESDVHAGDALTQFWARIRQCRLALAAGSVVTAEQVLQVPPTGLPIPEPAHAILLIERGFLASMAADGQTLNLVTEELRERGAHGEAALLEGLRLELEGDPDAALNAYLRAKAQVSLPQPATMALAHACAAQLLDARGEPAEALVLLREAATLTEVRRNAVPYLGWSRLGTPIGALLDRLLDDAPSEWIHELATLAHHSPDISTVLAPTTANLRERVHAAGPAVSPALSARERDVLNELARGATYADIAATLYITENTVKKHISSLYGKLGATRRSEALAAARTQRLL